MKKLLKGPDGKLIFNSNKGLLSGEVGKPCPNCDGCCICGRSFLSYGTDVTISPYYGDGVALGSGLSPCPSQHLPGSPVSCIPVQILAAIPPHQAPTATTAYGQFKYDPVPAINFCLGQPYGMDVSYYPTVEPTSLRYSFLISGSPTGGTFRLGHVRGGSRQTTGNIAYNATLAAFQSAITGLSNYTTGDYVISKPSSTRFQIDGVPNPGIGYFYLDDNSLAGGSSPSVSVSSLALSSVSFHNSGAPEYLGYSQHLYNGRFIANDGNTCHFCFIILGRAGVGFSLTDGTITGIQLSTSFYYQTVTLASQCVTDNDSIKDLIIDNEPGVFSNVTPLTPDHNFFCTPRAQLLIANDGSGGIDGITLTSCVECANDANTGTDCSGVVTFRCYYLYSNKNNFDGTWAGWVLKYKFLSSTPPGPPYPVGGPPYVDDLCVAWEWVDGGIDEGAEIANCPDPSSSLTPAALDSTTKCPQPNLGNCTTCGDLGCDGYQFNAQIPEGGGDPEFTGPFLFESDVECPSTCDSGWEPDPVADRASRRRVHVCHNAAAPSQPPGAPDSGDYSP